MAPKKRPVTTPIKPALEITLNDEALDDLRYLEPTRTRKRVIGILEELYNRVHRLEVSHHEPHTAPKPKR